MSDRERTDDGTFRETVTPDAVLGVFDTVRGPVVTSSDVSDALDCSAESARQKLATLYDRGEVDKRKTGRTVVWWHTGGERITPDERAGEDHAERARETADARPEDPDDQRDGTPPTTDTEPVAGALDAVDFPSTTDREQCLAAVGAAREYLRDHGSGTMRELVGEVMPDHALGYDVPDLDRGDRYRGSWWRKVVKPGLKALDDVDAPGPGGSKWTYTGDAAEDADAGGVYDPTEEF